MPKLKERKSAKRSSVKAFKVLGGIDSLYYFADTSNDALYQSFFDNMLNLCENFSFDDFQATYCGSTSSKSSGFGGVWYSVTRGNCLIARIGFKSGLIQRNVHNIFVQLDGESIYRNGLLESIIIVFDFLCHFCSSPAVTKKNTDDLIVNRADINAFVSGWDFSIYNSPDYFKTPFYRQRLCPAISNDYCDIYYNANEMESIYFGTRGGSWRFKLYNKGLEIVSHLRSGARAPAAMAKLLYLIVNGLLKHGSTHEEIIASNCWNLEFSFKREFLKQCKLYTVSALLDNSQNLFNLGLKKIELLDADLSTIQKARSSGHLNRLPVSFAWQSIGEKYNSLEVKPIERHLRCHKQSTADGVLKTALYKLRNYGCTADSIIDAFNNNIDIVYAPRFCDLPASQFNKKMPAF